jgi:maleate cis-trans isomerase
MASWRFNTARSAAVPTRRITRRGDLQISPVGAFDRAAWTERIKMTDRATRAVLVVPGTNTTMEREMTALCPDMAPFTMARIAAGARIATPADLKPYTEATLACLAPFVADPPDIVFHGCTAAGFLAGPGGNADIVAAIERHTGAPVVSTAQSMVDVLRAHRMMRVSVVTPYAKTTNDGLIAFLAAFGIAVDRLDSFLCQSVDEMLLITEEQVFQRALGAVAPGSQGLFLACTQMPSHGIIGPLREKLGIPVWSSISATAWAGEIALRRMREIRRAAAN